MKILKVKQSSNLMYKVTLDNDEVYKLVEDVVVKHRLFTKNREISEEELKEILTENDYYSALNNAYKYIEVLHSKKEIKDHLLKKYDKSIVRQVIAKLEEQNLINELEYANYLLNYARRNLKGITYLEYELKNQEISQDIIDEVLFKYDDELEICEKCFEKNMNNYKNISQKEYLNKMKNYLIGRGFSNNNIIIMLEKNIHLLDNIIDNSKALSLQYEKLLKSYANKPLSEKERDQKITSKLLAKGFSLNEIKQMKRSRG